MPTIRYRKDNRYELRFYLYGKQYSVYDRDKTKLKQKYNKKLRELKKKPSTPKDTYFTLKDWYQLWLNTYKKPFVKIDTLNNIEIYFNKHIFPVFKNSQLKEISTEKLQIFLNNLPKNRTKELVITYFNACLQKAFDHEYIKKNPFNLIVKEKKLNKVRNAFTIDEQALILNYLKSNDYEFYKLTLFYLCTGTRRNEALSLTSLDFAENKIHIKGTKTQKSDRYILITNELKSLIFKDDIIFDFKPDYVTHKFKEILRELNLDGTLHCLRHSYATNHYILGTPAKEIQLNLGHSSIDITLDIYTNINITDNKTLIKEKIKQLYNMYYISLKD